MAQSESRRGLMGRLQRAMSGGLRRTPSSKNNTLQPEAPLSSEGAEAEEAKEAADEVSAFQPEPSNDEELAPDVDLEAQAGDGGGGAAA